MSETEASRRLQEQLNARKLRNLRAYLESLPPEGLKLAGIVGPAGLSKFDEAKAVLQTNTTNFAASCQSTNEAVVVWLARHPDGQRFLQARGI